MVILRLLFLPFAALYDLVTGLRNRLYNLGLKPSVGFDLPVIGVGNLAAGGTGKSPMIEYLIRLLSQNYQVATLSRGYGRKTKGMRIGNKLDDASTLGDEPFQFYRKFSSQITVAVGEDRVYAIPSILHQFPETQVVLMDDAYQHRRVRPLFNILLTEYKRPFYSDFLLPAGRLRESRKGANRADVVVVTKCPPEISDNEMVTVEKRIRKYTDKRVFFTRIQYGFPVAFGGNKQSFHNKIILVSGIANHRPLEEYVKSNFDMARHVIYNDHHNYSISDMEHLLKIIRNDPDVIILTTEKDMVKMDTVELAAIASQIPLFYLPIEIEFLKDGEDFDGMVLSNFNQARDN